MGKRQVICHVTQYRARLPLTRIISAYNADTFACINTTSPASSNRPPKGSIFVSQKKNGVLSRLVFQWVVAGTFTKQGSKHCRVRELMATDVRPDLDVGSAEFQFSFTPTHEMIWRLTPTLLSKVWDDSCARLYAKLQGSGIQQACLLLPRQPRRPWRSSSTSRIVLPELHEPPNSAGICPKDQRCQHSDVGLP